MGVTAAGRRLRPCLVDTIGNISNLRNTLYDNVRDARKHPGDDGRADDHDTGVDSDRWEGSRDEGSWKDDENWEDDDSWEDDEDWGWPADHRWRPIALFIGAIVAVGAVATAVIINSGDSATTKATVGAPTPRTVISTTPRSPVPPSLAPTPSNPQPGRQLPPETVTTLTPPSNAPGRPPTAAPAPTLVPPGATLSPSTVVYSVTGTKQMFDLVNIVYTDARGFPVTEFNVALPWTKAVVLNPGVQTESVIATSIYGQLNCSIVNAQGQLVKASTTNSALATCTR